MAIHGSKNKLIKNICVSSLALSFCLAGNAFAQEKAEASSETIVITGVRKAAQSAQTIKKNSDLVVDSIVAEDVGKLPDNNVADSLARVTGIQVRRDSGEANSVLIRGLPNVVTLLNGREVFTTTGRYIALADIPANMLQRVDVYKSASPGQIEGGIAGSIDVRTRRPFDTKGFSLNVNARDQYNDKADSHNPNLGATISNRWNTGAGEFGALLGLSYMSSKFHEERAFNIESVDQTGFFAANPPLPNRLPAGTSSIKAPFVMGYIPISGQRDRSTASLALQWRPDENTELYAEGFVTNYKNIFSLDFFVGLPLLGDGNISATVYPGTNILRTLTNRNVFTITSTQANDHESDTSQFAVGGYRRFGNFKLSTDISITNSKFDTANPILDIGFVVPLVQVNTNANGTAQLNYGGPGFDIKNIPNADLINFFDNYSHDKGDAVDWRTDLVYTPGNTDSVVKEISTGFRFATRNAEHINQFIGGSGGPVTPTRVSQVPGLASLSERMASGGPDYIMTQWFTPSRDFLLNNTGDIRRIFTGTTNPKPLDPGSFFSIKEETAAFYTQMKVSDYIGDMPWNALIGLRAVQTKSSLKGNLSQDTNPNNPGLEYTPIDRETETLDILPSANLKLSIRPDLVARLTAGRTITRPNFPDLNPGVSLSTVVSNTTGLTGGGGNPNLQPVKSNNYDLSLEWYFAPDGFLTGTAFKRNFNGYVVGSFGNETFGGLAYRVSRPGNSGDGELSGFELGYQQFYSNLPGALSGLGLQGNVTWMDGDITNTDSGKTDSITGVSNLSYNVALLYEKGSWSGRLAYNWRDEFLDVRSFTPTYDLYVAETAQMDGQISYKYSPNLTFTLEGINLLDTNFKDFFKDPANPQLDGFFPRDTRRYDRTILVGFRWKM